jgi:hypothetical protein
LTLNALGGIQLAGLGASLPAQDRLRPDSPSVAPVTFFDNNTMDVDQGVV